MKDWNLDKIGAENSLVQEFRYYWMQRITSSLPSYET